MFSSFVVPAPGMGVSAKMPMENIEERAKKAPDDLLLSYGHPGCLIMNTRGTGLLCRRCQLSP